MPRAKARLRRVFSNQNAIPRASKAHFIALDRTREVLLSCLRLDSGHSFDGLAPLENTSCERAIVPGNPSPRAVSITIESINCE